MKKLFSKILPFGLIAALLIPMLCFAASAAAAGTISVSKTEMYPTDTVVISYRLSGNTETVAAAQMTLFYDNQAFEFVSVSSDYFNLAGFTPNIMAEDSTIRLSQFGGTGTAAAGAVFAVTFKPTANAIVGKTYEFAFGAKGRSSLQVSSNKAAGDIIQTVSNNDGQKVVTASVKIIEKPRYTVTYTDGVDGSVLFQDQVYTVESGKATPKFQGTPKRADYVFAGWSPTVAGTVTKNVTYTAVWKKEAAKYTVTYTDGVDGETVFPDQTYTVTEGSATPAFNGTPARSGYVFVKWTPEVAATVIADAAYRAEWKRQLSVTYTDGVDGAVLFPDQTYTYLEGETLPAFQGTPQREGYKFLGWNLPTGTVTSDITVTPIWEEDNQKVFVAVIYTDGVPDADIFTEQIYAVEKGSATPAFYGEPKRNGYIFVGWMPAVAETLEADTVYTAIWKERSVDFTAEGARVAGENYADVTVQLPSVDAGSVYIREYDVLIEDDGYTSLKILCGGSSSAVLGNAAVLIENPADGTVLYSGAIASVPADLAAPLNGKAGETARVRFTFTMNANLTSVGEDAAVPVTFSLGERDACDCILCAVIRAFGGPYCCCHLCVFILILILIILVLTGIIVWLVLKMKNAGTPSQNNRSSAKKTEPRPQNGNPFDDEQ